jgi:cell division protein FtsB
MDFRVKQFSKIVKFPQRAGEGLRAVVEQAPRAEALAASWIEYFRPLGTRVYGMRRRIATITVAVVSCLLFVHVLFGANGMVVYKQKRTEYELLQKKVTDVQVENQRYAQQVQALQSDPKAIEKEAREQLGYAKPGERIYVSPPPEKAEPIPTKSAKK